VVAAGPPLAAPRAEFSRRPPFSRPLLPLGAGTLSRGRRGGGGNLPLVRRGSRLRWPSPSFSRVVRVRRPRGPEGRLAVRDFLSSAPSPSSCSSRRRRDRPLAEIPALGRGFRRGCNAYLIPLPALRWWSGSSSTPRRRSSSRGSPHRSSRPPPPRGAGPALLFLLLSGTAGPPARAGFRQVPDVDGRGADPPVCALARRPRVSPSTAAGSVVGGIFGAVNVSCPARSPRVMPVAESAFRTRADIRLMELSGTGHPLSSPA